MSYPMDFSDLFSQEEFKNKPEYDKKFASKACENRISITLLTWERAIGPKHGGKFFSCL